ncbi:hypothetical protein CHKEEEPN_4942 [Methylorubrum podarium]|nr:hypothetical protein CHKEEEPN_4942 [Methylorubrum podarium]
MVGAGILADDEDRVRLLEVFEQHRALADADGLNEGDAARLVAHVRAIGEVVGAVGAGEELVEVGRLQRGGLPLPALRPRLRHQQLPRLLEHVPRGERHRPRSGHRHRQGHGAARRLREGGRDLRRRPESRHQPSAHAGRPAPGRRARRAGRGAQPRARARAGALRRPAEQRRDAARREPPDRQPLLPAEARRRHGRLPRHRQGRLRPRRGGDRGGQALAPRPRLHRRPYQRLCRVPRGGRGDGVGGDPRPVGPDPRGDRDRGRRLSRGRPGDRDLGDGRDPAPPLGGDDPRDRQPPVPARPYRPARRGPVPGARPFQRAGRPHGRNQREAAARPARSARPGIRSDDAAPARPQRARRHRRDARRLVEGLHRARGQLRARHAGHAAGREGARGVRTHRPHRDEAQPLAPRAGPGRLPAALPRPHGDRPQQPGQGADRDRRGFDEHGPWLGRHQQARLATSALGDRHHRRHGRRRRRLRADRLGRPRRRLRSHPRPDRADDSGVCRLQHPGAPTARLHAAQSRRRAGVRDGDRPGGLLQRAAAGGD